MKRRVSAVVLACSVILNVSFVAGYVFKRLAASEEPIEEEIEASPDQRAQMSQKREEFLRSLDEIAQRMSRLHTELVDTVAREPADLAGIDGKVGEIRNNQQAMQLLVVHHLLAVKELLTPGQRVRFFAMLKERMQSQTFGPRWLPRQGGKQGKQF